MPWTLFEHNGQKHRLAVVRTSDGVWVGWPGRSAFFAREHKSAAAGAVAEGELRAPMTARVVKIPAVAGAKVAKGNLLVILEAMKMEYRLTAPFAGTVDAVHAKEGALMDLGQVLVTVKPENGRGTSVSRSS